MKPIDVRRSTVTLDPDPTHVLARPFRFMSDQRSIKITARVMALPENQVHTLLGGVRAEFADRQLKIDEFLLRRFNEVSPYVLDAKGCPRNESCCWAGILPTSIRSKPLRCSIPRWCRTRISRTCRLDRCVSF